MRCLAIGLVMLAVMPAELRAQETAKEADQEPTQAPAEGSAVAPATVAQPATVAPSPIARSAARPWTLGFGGRLPDGLPLELTRQLSDRWSVRGWVSAPLNLAIEESQESEAESFFDSIIIATPATNVMAKVRYGPAFGFDGLYRPFSSGFFVAGGVSYYQLVGNADKSTPLLICFDVAQPCNASTASYRTASELEIKATAKEQGIRTAGSAGWTFAPSERVMLGVTVGGLSYRLWKQRSVDVDSALGDDPGLSDLAKEQVQYVLPEKEKTLERKVTDKMDAYNRNWMPVIGFSAGFRF